MSPPAEAAFFGSASDANTLRDLAIDAIEGFLEQERGATRAPDPKHDGMVSAALQYAEALLRQEEINDKLERAARDESSLHCRLSDGDRARVDDFLLRRGGMLLDALTGDWRRFVEHLDVRPESFAYEDYE